MKLFFSMDLIIEKVKRLFSLKFALLFPKTLFEKISSSDLR